MYHGPCIGCGRQTRSFIERIVCSHCAARNLRQLDERLARIEEKHKALVKMLDHIKWQHSAEGHEVTKHKDALRDIKSEISPTLGGANGSCVAVSAKVY